jgi:WD40 repeat protein
MEPAPPSTSNRREEEDEEGDSSDEENEDEPELKYERVGGDIAKVVRGDLVSAFCVGSKLIVHPEGLILTQAIGSHNGKIYLFDLKGNEIKRVKAHTASVSDLSIDKTSEYLASSSIEGLQSVGKLILGKVIVQALELKENNIIDFKRPVRCVALDPDYAKSSSRRVVSGGMAGQLIMSEKGANPASKLKNRLVWEFRDDVTFGGRADLCYFLEGAVYCLDQRCCLSSRDV